MKTARLRVAILWITFGPYHVARLEALEALSRYDLLAVECAAVERLRGWEGKCTQSAFRHVTLVSGAWEEADKTLVGQRAEKVLAEFEADVVVTAGYAERPMRRCAVWARRNGKVSILMSASGRGDHVRFAPREWLKGVWVRRHYDAAFVGGERNASYLTDLGFPHGRVWRGYDVVENRTFRDGAAVVRQNAQVWRERLALHGPYFLFAGRFALGKNLARLLAAYREYARLAGKSAWDLVLVGAGPEEACLRRLAVAPGPGAVHIRGWQGVEQLTAYYGLASCLVLPSRSEPWGLVVNEAMAAGLPVLVSTACGSAGDLVSPGLNGYMFHPRGTVELARTMMRMASERADRSAMGEASVKIISRYTPENWARILADCIDVCVSESAGP